VRSHTIVQCHQRWQKAIKPRLLKGKWSSSEDEILKHLVSLNLGNWAEVALKLPGRTSKQLRERW
jgi:myb proto-oncogene protein